MIPEQAALHNYTYHMEFADAVRANLPIELFPVPVSYYNAHSDIVEVSTYFWYNGYSLRLDYETPINDVDSWDDVFKAIAYVMNQDISDEELINGIKERIRV